MKKKWKSNSKKEDTLVLCLLTKNLKKKEIKKKGVFVNNVEKPMEANMLCPFNGETFHSFTKSTLIGSVGVSGHIADNDTGLYDITDANMSVQGSLAIWKRANYE